MRTLIVDDQVLIALTLADVLADAGHEVIGPAFDSRSAIELATRYEVEVAFVDIDLECLDAGLTVAKTLHDRGVPVFFMSGRPQAALRSCALGCLAKPFKPSSVLATLNALQQIITCDPTIVRSLPTMLQLFPHRRIPQHDPSRVASARKVLVIKNRPDEVARTIAGLKRHRAANRELVPTAFDDVRMMLDDNEHAGHDGLPAFILFDIEAPSSESLSLLRSLKSHPRLRTVPVIVFSASGASDDVRHCYECGANAYVTKPRDDAAFAAALERVGRFWSNLNRSPPPRLH